MSNFVEGKWYTAYNPKHYMKCKSSDNEYLFGDEYIDNFGFKTGRFSWDIIDAKLIISLDEIQEYLPDGHIDKYTTLNKEENYDYLIDILKKHNIN